MLHCIIIFAFFQCGPNYKMVKFEWRNNSISHLYPPPYTACLGGCDTSFLELMNINLSSVRTVPESSRTQANSAARQPETARPNNTNNATANRQNSTGQLPNRPNGRDNRQNSLPDRPSPSTNDSGWSNPSADRSNSSNSWSKTTTSTVPVVPSRPQPNSRQFQPPPQANRAPNASNQGMPGPGGDGAGDVLCGCNKPAILLTVRKQTANIGE